MANPMSPSEITIGQIAKFQEIIGHALRKSGLPNEPVQQVLEQQGGELADEFVAKVRARVEMVSGTIVRKVKINRNRAPQEALDATDRKQYTNRVVVDGMLKGEGEEVEVVCFKPLPEEYTRPGFMSDEDLEKALLRRGLVHDPMAVIAMNEADPAFADIHPNGTHWKDTDGRWCYAAFLRWIVAQHVYVNRDDYDWGVLWWFAGVRKSTQG